MATLPQLPPLGAAPKSRGRSDNVATPTSLRGETYSASPKTTGIKMRGTGAATKGVMSRGPMA
jgi:hypothetical protein